MNHLSRLYICGAVAATFLMLSAAGSPEAPRPRTLAAGDLAKLRGGDWVNNRECRVPDHCQDDPFMDPCENITGPILCPQNKEDEVLAEMKDCTKDSTTKRCNDGRLGMDDCRIVYGCEFLTQPTPHCIRDGTETPSRTAKECVQESMPITP
jgi:hypothetical protein